MKKRRLLSLIISILLLIMGCGEKKIDTSVEENIEYNGNAWNNGLAKICRNNDGYYAASGEFVYTIQENNISPLCNKADCNHENEECNAYLKGIQEQTIWYDGDVLYIIGEDDGGRYSVYEIKTDGSGNRKICDVFQTTGVSSFGISCDYKDDYMYYHLSLLDSNDISTGHYSEKLYRIRLVPDAKPELIYENEDESISVGLGRCYFYNDAMYVTISQYDNEGKQESYGLYKYIIEENKLELFLNRFMAYYFIYDDILYYTNDDGIHKCDLNGENDELFCENPVFCDDMYFDGEYIYLTDVWYQLQKGEHSDTQNIYVLDLTGEELKTISIDWNRQAVFGDGEYIITQVMYVSYDKETPQAIDEFDFYDKKQIATQENVWINIRSR